MKIFLILMLATAPAFASIDCDRIYSDDAYVQAAITAKGYTPQTTNAEAAYKILSILKVNTFCPPKSTEGCALSVFASLEFSDNPAANVTPVIFYQGRTTEGTYTPGNADDIKKMETDSGALIQTMTSQILDKYCGSK